MGRVIAVANQKGGVAKTTTAVNLGIGLAREGKRVLLVDTDPQGSLTASLGYVEPDEIPITLANILTAVINEEEVIPSEGILHHEEDIDIMPGNIELSALEVVMGNVMSRELILKDYIDMMRERYDYILIDCMPSLGMMTINALVAADSVLIPVQAAYLPVDVDGRNNSVPHKNKEYEILYREILKGIQYEDTKRQKEKKREIPKNVHRITSKDFVVRTNVFRCISDKHHLEEVLGIIQVLRPDGSITEEKVTASYCKECCCYFLLRSEYDRVFNKGILLCKMIEKEEFYKSGINGFSDIKGESVLMQNGYNVQAKVGLTDIQRQTILANIMDEKILSASQIISYLQFFKAQKRNLPSYKMAVDKWDADLQFTKLYQQDKKQRVFINSITKTRYRKPT